MIFNAWNKIMKRIKIDAKILNIKKNRKYGKMQVWKKETQNRSWGDSNWGPGRASMHSPRLNQLSQVCKLFENWSELIKHASPLHCFILAPDFISFVLNFWIFSVGHCSTLYPWQNWKPSIHNINNI